MIPQGTPAEVAARLAHAERKAVEWQAEAIALREGILAKRVAKLEDQITLITKILDEMTKPTFAQQYQPAADALMREREIAKAVAVIAPTATEEHDRSSRDVLYAHREALLKKEEEAEDLSPLTEEYDKTRLWGPLVPGDRHYEERRAEVERGDLIVQRRRNFPLDPPSSASEWDEDL